MVAWVNYNDTTAKKVGTPPSNVNQAQGIFDKYSQSSITDTTPKWRVTAGALWKMGIVSANLRESARGPTSQLATYAITGADYRAIAGTKFVIDLELGVELFKGLKIAAGANNLFNVYPDKYPAAARLRQYQASLTAYVSQYPSFSLIASTADIGAPGNARSIEIGFG